MLTGKQIKENRIKQGFSQYDLADAISAILIKNGIANVSHSTISKWENEHNKPSPIYQKALITVFGINEKNSLFTDLIKKHIEIEYKLYITGEWSSKWSFQKGEKILEYESILTIKRQGDLILGESKSEKHQYMIVAYFTKDRILSGKWFSSNNSSSHHGVFSIQINRTCKTGIGKWIGTTDDNMFNFGEWKLRRITFANTQYKKLGRK